MCAAYCCPYAFVLKQPSLINPLSVCCAENINYSPLASGQIIAWAYDSCVLIFASTLRELQMRCDGGITNILVSNPGRNKAHLDRPHKHSEFKVSVAALKHIRLEDKDEKYSALHFP